MTAKRRGRPTWSSDDVPAAPSGPPRDCAGQIEHRHIAEQLIETGLAAFGSDEPNYLRLSQSFKLAERLLKSGWAGYMAERQKAA